MNKGLRRAIIRRDDFRCWYCGKDMVEGRRRSAGEKRTEIEIDHVLPRSRGGSDAPINLVCACCDCNLTKKDRTVEEYRHAIADRLFTYAADASAGRLPHALGNYDGFNRWVGRWKNGHIVFFGEETETHLAPVESYYPRGARYCDSNGWGSFEAQA